MFVIFNIFNFKSDILQVRRRDEQGRTRPIRAITYRLCGRANETEKGRWCMAGVRKSGTRALRSEYDILFSHFHNGVKLSMKVFFNKRTKKIGLGSRS